MAKRRSRRSGGFGMGGINAKKILMAGLAAGGAMLLAAKYAPQVDGKLAAAVGGFVAGGPIGAAVGYVGVPMLLQAQGTASAGTGDFAY